MMGWLRCRVGLHRWKMTRTVRLEPYLHHYADVCKRCLKVRKPR